MSCISPSPSPRHEVPGGKKGQRTTISDSRALCLPYQRRPLDSPPTPASPLSRLDYSSLTPSPLSLRPSTSPSVSSNPDDVLTPEFMRSLRFRTPGTPMIGPSPLPGSHSPAISTGLRSVPHPQRPSKSHAKSPPSPSQPAQNVVVNAFRQPEEFAHRYCRYPGCDRRFPDKRTTERHRLTHLSFGTYVCPNPACDSRTKARPHFASDFSLGRHLKLAKNDSLCAVGKGQKLSSFKRNAPQAEALIKQALVPFDPAIHTPF